MNPSEAENTPRSFSGGNLSYVVWPKDRNPKCSGYKWEEAENSPQPPGPFFVFFPLRAAAMG